MKTTTLLLTLIAAVLTLAPVESKEPKTESTREFVLYDGSVRKVAIRVVATTRPFDASKHKTTPLRKMKGGDTASATVDGREVVGLDGVLPSNGTPQLASLSVTFGKKRVDVPSKFLHHVFLPHFATTFTKDYADTLVSVSADGTALILDLGVGDGGGTGTYILFVNAEGNVSNKAPDRPEP